MRIESKKRKRTRQMVKSERKSKQENDTKEETEEEAEARPNCVKAFGNDAKINLSNRETNKKNATNQTIAKCACSKRVERRRKRFKCVNKTKDESGRKKAGNGLWKRSEKSLIDWLRLRKPKSK